MKNKNTLPVPVRPKHKRTKAQIRKDVTGYIFILPIVINLIVFHLYPLISSFYLSFTEYNIISPAKFIGWDNYKKMFLEDPIIWASLKVTFKYAIISVPLSLAVSLLVAVIMTYPSKMTNFYRVIFYIPSLIGGGVACATVWKMVWKIDGPVNMALQSMGLEPIRWMTDTKLALYNIILLGVWQFGGQMIIFLAALKNVPKELLEAAKVDGATPIKSFFKITLPIVTSAIFFNLINGIIGALQQFNAAFLVTQGGPLNSTRLYGLYQYTQAFEYQNFGYASAMAWFLTVIIVAMTAVVFKSSSTWVYYQDEG